MNEDHAGSHPQNEGSQYMPELCHIASYPPAESPSTWTTVADRETVKDFQFTGPQTAEGTPTSCAHETALLESARVRSSWPVYTP